MGYRPIPEDEHASALPHCAAPLSAEQWRRAALGPTHTIPPQGSGRICRRHWRAGRQYDAPLPYDEAAPGTGDLKTIAMNEVRSKNVTNQEESISSSSKWAYRY